MRPATLLLLAACGLADAAYFQPDRVEHSQLDRQCRDVWFAADGGPELHGVWLDARGASRGTVVYCHGTDRNVTRHATLIAWLAERGYDVLVFDYRGYGRSLGRPSRRGMIDDTRAAIDLALRRDPGRTAVYGRSLGGAFAVLATVDRPQVRALVLESSMAGWRSAAQRRFPALAWLVPLLVSDGPDPVAVVPRLGPMPLFVAHATGDYIVPFTEGVDLYDAHLGPKTLWIERADTHASAAGYDPIAFTAAVDRFLTGALAR